MFRIEPPDHAGSRDQAQELVLDLPKDLAGKRVVLDCSSLVIGTPSFLDEIVKQVLEQRGAETLEVSDAPERARELLERAATNRGVSSHLRVAVRFG